jgi:uncharacterized membrane protein
MILPGAIYVHIAYILSICGTAGAFSSWVALGKSSSWGQSNRRQDGRGRGEAVMKWIDNKVTIAVPASTEEAFSAFVDIENQPTWRSWLHKVVVTEPKEASVWTARSLGLES